ncbi:MAG: hypothetical protein AMS24_00600 [Chlamydiae bacterium SM23_39]|nr:MAG: hypothetical protein AMS24_00600 [Chlamydiae bacterium SM23_39]
MVDIKKFKDEKYNLSITSKNVAITSAIEKYILEKVTKLDRFSEHIVDIVVTLDLLKVANIVTINMKIFRFMLRVQARTENLYSAIDKAFERLIKLMKKYKDKMQHYRFKEPQGVEIAVRVLKPVSYVEEINEQIEDENLKEEEELYKIHEVVSQETMPIVVLTQDEAVLKLEFSKDHFLVYKSEEDKKLKIMYKREDDKIGLISVEK